MQQTEILQKRNLFIYYTFIISLMLYALSIYIGIFEYHVYFPIVLIGVALILGFLFYVRISPQIMRVCLLVVYNLITVFLVIQSQHFITFYWFIFLLLMVSIYRSPKIVILLAFITSFEVAIILIFFFKTNTFSQKELIDLYIFYILFISSVGVLQAFFIRRLWRKTENTNLQKERQLTSTEAYLRLFFHQAQDAIAVFDLQERVIDVNPAFEKLYGWSREECIGKKLTLVPSEYNEAARQRWENLLKGERYHLLETKDMTKDGTVLDVQISLSPLYDTNNELIALSVISRDMSVVKENERLILQSEKLKVAGEIAAGVAHEIRNPMTVISGFVQMMNADEKSPYKMYTELIQSEIERIDVIISEFLVLSRPQMDTFKPIKLDKILQELKTLYSVECQQREIDLTLKLNDSYTSIHGNPNQIKQVFINILKNAIEAIDQQGSIHIELYNDTDELYIFIRDTGCGIPAPILERIFEPFYTTKSKGTGLGMMITNKIIQEHKGSIKIHSEEQIGTEILISFPNSPLPY